jgi:ribonuclease HI
VVNDQHHWRRMWFKDGKVWLATDGSGRPIEKNGRLLIKYRRDQDHEYWVNPRNLSPLEADPGPRRRRSKRPGGGTPVKVANGTPAEAADGVHVYTDGASSGNPGPAGIGILLLHGGREREIARFIGTATNNIAELEAIRTALAEVRQRDLPVRVYTDSSYAHGVLTLGWKAKKNEELIGAIKALMKTFTDLAFIKVRGHAGDACNERADRLARLAATEGDRRKR